MKKKGSDNLLDKYLISSASHRYTPFDVLMSLEENAVSD